MRFINWGLVLLFAVVTIVGCSTTDSGSDLLNQAITPTKNSTGVTVANAADKSRTSVHVEDNSRLIDDSIQQVKQTTTSNNKSQLKVVKVSTPSIVPLKTLTMAAADSQVEGRVALVPVPVKLIAESHQYTIIKVNNKSLPTPMVWKIYLSDKVISNTLERWAEEGGYQLVWKSQHDFEITSEATINGNMKEAFNQVLLSFVDTNTPIKATWYKNKVIVITSFSE